MKLGAMNLVVKMVTGIEKCSMMYEREASLTSVLKKLLWFLCQVSSRI